MAIQCSQEGTQEGALFQIRLSIHVHPDHQYMCISAVNSDWQWLSHTSGYGPTHHLPPDDYLEIAGIVSGPFCMESLCSTPPQSCSPPPCSLLPQRRPGKEYHLHHCKLKGTELLDKFPFPVNIIHIFFLLLYF